MNNPDRELTDGDVERMAIETEAENMRRHARKHRPFEYHRRRAAIRLGVMPLPDMTLGELVWHLELALRRADRRPGQ